MFSATTSHLTLYSMWQCSRSAYYYFYSVQHRTILVLLVKERSLEHCHLWAVYMEASYLAKRVSPVVKMRCLYEAELLGEKCLYGIIGNLPSRDPGSYCWDLGKANYSPVPYLSPEKQYFLMQAGTLPLPSYSDSRITRLHINSPLSLFSSHRRNWFAARCEYLHLIKNNSQQANRHCEFFLIICKHSQRAANQFLPQLEKRL